MAKATATDKNRALLLVVVFANSFSTALILPVIPFFVIHTGAGVVAGGWLVTISAICSVVGAPILGRLSDRYGRKTVLLLTLCGTGTSFLLFATAHSFAQVFISQVVAGLMAGNLSTAQAAMADSSSSSDRGKLLARIAGVWALGFVLGPAVSAAVATPANPVLVPGLVATIGSFIAAVTFGMVFVEQRDGLSANATQSKPPAARISLVAVVTGAMALSLAALVLVALCQSGMIAMIGYWAHQVLGWSQWNLSWLMAWVAMGSVLTQLAIAPVVFKRLSNQQALSGALAVSVAGCVTIVTTQSAVGLFIGVPMIMSGLSLTSTVLNTTISHTAGQAQGVSMGLATSASAVGRIIGPVLLGLSFSDLGATSYFYWIGLICLALASSYPAIRGALDRAATKSRGFTGASRETVAVSDATGGPFPPDAPHAVDP